MTKPKTIAIVNASGRQAASLIRVASAVGYRVRAQIHTLEGVIPQELASLPNVTLFKGPLLNNAPLITTLFDGANLAFINTTSQAGDEVAIGRDLADAAKRAGSITHYIYSSMPDHAAYNPSRWISLPLWSCKFAVENYVRQLGLPATFVYAGIYNNNFTSLPYPLFQMELLENGSFEWRAPFHPDIPLPWLDAEHDVGPAVLQIFKDGPKKWNGHRIALSFETLTPNQVCAAFSRALRRPCVYTHSPKIDIKVSIPAGYREHLEGIEVLFGQMQAPYFPQPEFINAGHDQGQNHVPTPISTVATPTTAMTKKIAMMKGTGIGVGQKQGHGTGKGPGEPYGGNRSLGLVDEARGLWEGWRDMEEYAREVFPVEEEANGLDWMI
ncbi:nitrogen metabolite repression protein nmrA [Blastomyces dermatitidis ATCC 18188]|uniref:Nitrogen metabolite repression protein nmrA n=1 Tax=Ajellomyces dermatitidis (strain ATCC 18188 / CBS 674.68) TaxID=653446 RepID=F2TRN6_AJEDA|nr:nitrogen metabolite repression protein nmrA [Blastomyces dermatitidis ATCC 18188]